MPAKRTPWSHEELQKDSKKRSLPHRQDSKGRAKRANLNTAANSGSPWDHTYLAQTAPTRKHNPEAPKAHPSSTLPVHSPPHSGPWAPEALKQVGKRKGKHKTRRKYKAKVDITDQVVGQAGYLAEGSRREGEAPQQTKTAEEGADPKAIHKRWQGPGRCICQSGAPIPCHRALKLAALIAFCTLWHALSETEKWFLVCTLFSVVQEGSVCAGETVGKRNWYIQGTQLCFKNFCHLIKVGPATMRQYMKQGRNPAPPQPKGRRPGKHIQRDTVDYFFMELYCSAAEPLAKKPVPKNKIPTGSHYEHADIFLKDSPWLNSKGGLNRGEHRTTQFRSAEVKECRGPEDDIPDLIEDDNEDWNPDLPGVDLTGMLTQAAAGAPPPGLKQRWIQYTTLGILYWQFLSTWEVLKEQGFKTNQSMPEKPPCFVWFTKRWNELWSKFIRIRQVKEHAQCNLCFKLQQIIEDATLDLKSRYQAAAQLREHQRAQYLDRTLYWNLRFASQSFSDVLVIIVDSMDKAKFAWPSWPWERRPHDLADLRRPRMDQGVL